MSLLSRFTRQLPRAITLVSALVLTISPLATGLPSAQAAPGSRPPSGPTLEVRSQSVEYLRDPLGIDTAHPRLSWVMSASGRDAHQTAYQVRVATSPANLSQGADLSWDSGKVYSDRSVNVVYEGEPLASASAYYWQVRVWSRSNVSPWSKTSTFETGLLRSSDWVADWIAPATSEEGGSYLRNEFSAPTNVSTARLYVSGRGNYERGSDGEPSCCVKQFSLARGIYVPFLNGKRVGDAQLESTMVDTRKRALYRTYDVTELIAAGENMLGLSIGADSDVIAQLRVTTTDGEVKTLGTDATWTSAPGPVDRAHRYNGEIYDARKAIPGWAQVDDQATGDWQPVRVMSPDAGPMDAAVLEPMRVVATHEPVAITEPSPSVYVLDFGANISGWTKLSLDLPAGTTVTLKHGERLTKGRVDNAIPQIDQTNSYTAAGGPTTWEPSFVYAGFRWVEVTGLTHAPQPGEIVAREVHNDVPKTGHFTSDVDLLNRLHQANVQTQQNGLHAIPEDTPTREKRGWMADAHIAAEATINNFGMDAFYANWVEEMRAAQSADGRVPDIVPNEPGDFWGPLSDPAWGAAHVLIPAYLHERYGDDRALTDHYESMRQYVDYLATITSGDLITRPNNTWGNDWLSLEETDSRLFRSGFYYWDLRETAKAARLLGKETEAEELQARADRVATAINQTFLNKETDSYGPSQFANAFPLVLEIVPDEEVSGVVETLVDDVLNERDGHFTGGLPGIKYIPEALAMHGRSDVVLEVATNTTFPGWGYMLENGPGTIWENWTGDNSLNHPMFTTIDNWLYESVAGIDQMPGSTGYRHSVVAPQVTDRVHEGSASITTPYGELASEWSQQDGLLRQRVTIPTNTTSKITIPTDSTAKVREGGIPVRQARGVHAVRRTAEGVVVSVGSGTYTFTSPVAATSPIVIDSVRAEPRVLETDDTTTTVAARITNVSPTAVRAKLDLLSAPSGWQVVEPGTARIPAGATETLSLTVERSGDAAAGGAFVVAASTKGRQWATARTEAYVRGEGCAIDPTRQACLPTGFTLLHDFETDAEGWQRGENTSAANSVTGMANRPGTPYLGKRMLEAVSAPNATAGAWRSVWVNEPQAIPRDGADSVVAYVNSYGGAPSGPYLARLQVTSTSGEQVEQIHEITPDTWNEVRLSLEQWPGQDIAKIEVSFRAAGESVWPGNFQVDQVGLQ